MSLSLQSYVPYSSSAEGGDDGTYSVSLGLFGDRVLEQLQHAFAPLYERVYRDLWNNSVFANVRRPYYFCSWDDGVFEYYMPTTVNMEQNMNYFRIAVKVLGEIDRETVQREQPFMEWAWTRPMGVVDSELIAYVAQRPSERLKEEIKRHGRKAYLRGFRHKNRRGYLTAIIVNESPEICVKRLKTLIIKFLEKRVKKLLEKLKLQPWMLDNYLYKTVKGLPSSLLILIEKFSPTIRNILLSMARTVLWLRDKLKLVMREIGRQNMLKTRIRPLIKEMRETLAFILAENVMKNPYIQEPPIVKQLAVILKPP